MNRLCNYKMFGKLLVQWIPDGKSTLCTPVPTVSLLYPGWCSPIIRLQLTGLTFVSRVHFQESDARMETEDKIRNTHKRDFQRSFVLWQDLWTFTSYHASECMCDGWVSAHKYHQSIWRARIWRQSDGLYRLRNIIRKPEIPLKGDLNYI